MADKHEITVACSHCQARKEITIYGDINVAGDPELKEQVVSGSIFSTRCDNCGRRLFYDYPLLYCDPERQYNIYLRPDYHQDASDQYRELADLLRKNQIAVEGDYRNRLVLNSLELIEKIQMFDAELDDRVMEVYKYLHKGKIMRQYPEVKELTAYFMVEHKPQIVFISEHQTFTTPFDKNLYDQLYDDFKGRLTFNNDFIKVDREWVIELLRNDYAQKNLA